MDKPGAGVMIMVGIWARGLARYECMVMVSKWARGLAMCECNNHGMYMGSWTS